MDYINIRTMLDAGEAYRTFEKTCEMLSQRPAYRECFKDVDVKEILKQDSLDFLLCIAVSDKALSFEEKENIAGIIRINIPYEDMKHRIEDKKLNTEKFYTSPPEILRVLHTADTAFYGFGGIYDNAYYSNMLVRFFSLIGDILISTDNYISPKEVLVYDTYIESMKRYIAENRPF